MDMLSLFRRRSGASDNAPAEPPDDVQVARTRARRRLVGAAVLVVAGIVGFPLLFETEPRPIAIDVPIEIPQREGAAPLQMPAARPEQESAGAGGKSGGGTTAAVNPRTGRGAEAAPKDESIITETVADAGREVPLPVAPDTAAAAARAAATAQRAAAAAAVRAASAAEARARPKPPAAAASRPAPSSRGSADAARAQALLEGRPVASSRVETPPAASSAAAAGASRFFVQIGAYAADESVQDTRSKAEKLGLRTYTQVAETSAGKRTRVRVGPFASREEAERAAAKLKSASLPAVILSP